MKSFTERYRRIAKDRLGLSSLWLGPDHLVYVKGSGFLMPLAEEYRRFRYADIEGLSVARTSRYGMGFLYLFGLLLCSASLTLILVLTQSLNLLVVVALSGFLLAGLGFLALLLRHWILGPTCICDIQTRLTRVRLRPLNRYHRAVEIIEAIAGLARESQSDVTISERSGTGDGELVGTGKGDRRTEGFRIPKPTLPTFALFFGLGLAALAALHLESVILTGLLLFGLLAGSMLLTVTLIAVVRTATPDSVRAFLWILLGNHFTLAGAGSVYFLVAATRDPAYTIGLAGPLEAFAGIATDGGLVGYGVFALLSLGFVVVGLWGFLEVGKWRRKLETARSLESGSKEAVREGDDE